MRVIGVEDHFAIPEVLEAWGDSTARRTKTLCAV
jgi:hypothetical protein